MARTSKKCPPGVLCISGGLGVTLIVILSVALLFLIFAVVYLKHYTQQSYNIQRPRQSAPIVSKLATAPTYISVKSGDSRYDMAPQPLRDWMVPPEYPPRGGIASIPINIPTQGLPDTFRSVGIMKVDDKILPIYGRRTAGGRGDRWNYYTRTDTYNPVPIPVRFQKRDCMDDVGCQEILSGDDVKVEVINKSGTANIYNYDGPKYIPGMI